MVNLPAIGAVGGPFRANGTNPPYTVHGSSNAEEFLALFERMATASGLEPQPRDRLSDTVAEGGSCQR